MKLQVMMDYALPVLAVVVIIALCVGVGWLALRYVTLD